MAEHAVYPNLFWCVENLSVNMKKDGPTVRLMKSNWKIKIVVYQCVGGDKIQVFLRREAPPQYCFDTFFYTITSICNDEGVRHLERTLKVNTSSTKICIWEAYIEELLKIAVNFKYRVNFFTVFQPGKHWKRFQDKNEVGRYDTKVSYTLPVLCQDFERLLNNHIHSDLILKCEEVEFPVHKAILCVRSQKFGEMLQEMKEEEATKLPLVLEVPDVKADVLKHMLRYIYFGEMPEDSLTLATRIYEAVQKYKVACWS